MSNSSNTKPDQENQSLIQITKHEISGKEVNAVCARDLHKFLRSRQDFSTWISHRLTYGFIEEEDFSILSLKSNGGRPLKEYYISMDMAKEISMLERNEKGQEARRYFIECEKIAKKEIQPQIPQTFAESLRLLADQVEKNEKQALQIEEQKPKVEFAESIYSSKASISGIDMAATHFSFGRNTLYKKLRKAKIFKEDNVPYRKYIDSGYFEVTQKAIERTLNNEIKKVPRFTPKGQEWLLKKSKELGWEEV